MSTYIDPNEVISPRRHWTLLMVLDPGSAGEIALCVGRWPDFRNWKAILSFFEG
jgi:hypothetical protein